MQQMYIHMLFALLDDVEREKWARRKTLPMRKSVQYEATRGVKIQIIRIHREKNGAVGCVVAECAVRASLHIFSISHVVSRARAHTHSAFETCVW